MPERLKKLPLAAWIVIGLILGAVVGLALPAAGTAPPEIHVVGGGALNAPLCQWTADATGLRVLAGPAEATAIGNLVVQAIALGDLASLDEARELVRHSFATEVYEPTDGDAWEAAYERFLGLADAANTPSGSAT